MVADCATDAGRAALIEAALACVHRALDATATTGVDLPVDVGHSTS